MKGFVLCSRQVSMILGAIKCCILNAENLGIPQADLKVLKGLVKVFGVK